MYERCAQQLVDSIVKWHPQAHVTVITERDLPRGIQPGFANDWQMYMVSPYRETVKLEADCVVSGPIDHWWDLFRKRDVVISQGCRDYQDKISNNRFYRRQFDDNNLPDVYNAITYWRVSATAQEFWRLVRTLFENWDEYRALLKYADPVATTDMVYAMAAQIMGPERVTLPASIWQPRIVHMKKHIVSTVTKDWTKELSWEYVDNVLRINTIAQSGLVHYCTKDWHP
jgi:hypothetical protein